MYFGNQLLPLVRFAIMVSSISSRTDYVKNNLLLILLQNLNNFQKRAIVLQSTGYRGLTRYLTPTATYLPECWWESLLQWLKRLLWSRPFEALFWRKKRKKSGESVLQGKEGNEVMQHGVSYSVVGALPRRAVSSCSWPFATNQTLPRKTVLPRLPRK